MVDWAQSAKWLCWLLSISRSSVYESVGEVLEFTIAAPHKIDVVANRKLHMGLPPMEMDAWWPWSISCMRFSRNKLNRMCEMSVLDGHLLLSWRTPLADCSRGLHSWSSHRVPKWLQPVLPPCLSLWGPATGLLAKIYQTPFEGGREGDRRKDRLTDRERAKQ